MTDPAGRPAPPEIVRWRLDLEAPGPARTRVLAELRERGAATPQLLASPELRAALRETLADESRTEQRRAADAIAPLAGVSPALAADLRAGLSDPRPRLRWGVAYTLARALPLTADLWPPIREALGLDDGDQRWAANEIATKLAASFPPVLEELVAIAHQGPPTARKMALYALRELARVTAATTPGDAGPNRQLLHAGLAAAACEDRGVRIAAIAALTAALATLRTATEHDRSTVADRLADLVDHDPDAGVRRASAAALAALGESTPRAGAALARAAESHDQGLARAARRRMR